MSVLSEEKLCGADEPAYTKGKYCMAGRLSVGLLTFHLIQTTSLLGETEATQSYCRHILHVSKIDFFQTELIPFAIYLLRS